MLHIDLETYSDRDIKKGIHQYVESPEFEIMIMAYAFDYDEPTVLDLKCGDQIPKRIKNYIGSVEIKVAHNAAFEICCLNKRLGDVTTAESWICTAVMARELGLPGSLGQLTHDALKMSQDKKKDKEGKALINYFCKPCKPTKVNGGRTRNLPEHDPIKWEKFKAYCGQDVVAEQEVYKRLSQVAIHPLEWQNWHIDQRINNRGARVDIDFVENALAIRKDMAEDLKDLQRQITGLDNPNSVAQLKGWVEEQLGHEVENLQAGTVREILETAEGDLKTVLTARLDLSKASLKKYDALKAAVCADSRIRGTLLFYGAIRTGRWAGRVFQPQNLPQNHLEDIEADRDVIKNFDYETACIYFDSVASVMSQLVRTAIIPSEGKKFIVADYSAVEARALAYVAGEKWRLDVFKGDGKIYETSASKAFKIPIEKITKGSQWRAQGKVLELACGYGGSTGAVASMDKNNDIPESERRGLVDAWREASPNIVQLWWDMDAAARRAVQNPSKEVFVKKTGVSFQRKYGFLIMKLPSGRRLFYPRPRMQQGKFGLEITYEGLNQQSRKWERQSTYGPKLVENLIQAYCRDLLMYGITELENEGYPVVLHVHDEAIVEVDKDVKVETIEKIMARKPKWAKGMPHRAEGFETMFYMKD